MILTSRRSKLLFFVLLIVISLLAAVFAVNMKQGKLSETASTEDNSSCNTLVIDPGHGGEDGGASSCDGVTESSINLDIALKLSALAEFSGCPSVMTRNSDEIFYPDSANTVSKRKSHDLKARAKLVEKTDGAVLISIHQNFYPHGSPKGPQVFFSKNEGSMQLAQLAQTMINKAVSPGNKRLAAPIAQKIFLMKNVSCPAILAECGFLSNKEEALLLQSEEYRLKLALALMSAYAAFVYNTQA